MHAIQQQQQHSSSKFDCRCTGVVIRSACGSITFTYNNSLNACCLLVGSNFVFWPSLRAQLLSRVVAVCWANGQASTIFFEHSQTGSLSPFWCCFSAEFMPHSVKRPSISTAVVSQSHSLKGSIHSTCGSRTLPPTLCAFICFPIRAPAPIGGAGAPIDLVFHISVCTSHTNIRERRQLATVPWANLLQSVFRSKTPATEYSSPQHYQLRFNSCQSPQLSHSFGGGRLLPKYAEAENPDTVRSGEVHAHDIPLEAHLFMRHQTNQQYHAVGGT